MMRAGTHLVALILLLTSLEAVLGGKDSKGSGRSRHPNDSNSDGKTGSDSTQSLTIKSSKGRTAARDTTADSNSRSGRSSKGRGKGQSPNVPDDLFRESGKCLNKFESIFEFIQKLHSDRSAHVQNATPF